jgi:TIR domain
MAGSGDRTQAGHPPPALGVFLSYRRDDSGGHAGRLYDALSSRFGEEKVFMDIDAIPLGVDFTKEITKRVESCDVLIVLLGRDWLIVTDDEGQRRLDNPEDFVRLEIEAALKRDVPVIPAFVRGARMPKKAELPTSLKPLAQRNGIELRDEAWRSDVERLVRALERLAQQTARRRGQKKPAANRAAAKRPTGDVRHAEQTAAGRAKPAAARKPAERGGRTEMPLEGMTRETATRSRSRRDEGREHRPVALDRRSMLQARSIELLSLGIESRVAELATLAVDELPLDETIHVVCPFSAWSQTSSSGDVIATDKRLLIVDVPSGMVLLNIPWVFLRQVTTHIEPVKVGILRREQKSARIVLKGPGFRKDVSISILDPKQATALRDVAASGIRAGEAARS